ncbi:flagellin FlaB [Methanofollis sp. W23]|uniref:archaellin/type IV pilin N-terminal domain-containing protein n=1 Tax=Methanofollis sp. W23 TaxID=2817849 RepID=UPI001AE82F22|nr:archaellin/type IV pilin N-terminal domain-containing protein [Methanofollis sp. W23]MBP2145177.1 flagellin FlaB [Methanofollis sp. W23]
MKFMRNEEGFTGLEAAIVLIAFVVVAAVFSYVMLGAGFFTSQKSQEVVHTSVEQASASMEIRGDVYGLNTTAASKNKVDIIDFTLSLTAGGTPVDINKTAMTYVTSEYAGVIKYKGTAEGTDPEAGTWSVYKRVDADKDYLVEPGEQFIVRLALPTDEELGANEKFSVDIRPPVGAALGLKRTVPPQIDAVNLLY